MRRRHVRPALAAAALVAAVLAPVPASGGAPGAFVDRAILDYAGYQSALVHVRPSAALADGVAALRAAGAGIGTRYPSIDVFVAYGERAQLLAAAQSPAIEALEANAPVELLTDSSHEATRGQRVLEGAVKLAKGRRIDGRGIGVAVVDSGVDGTHPDLASRMALNVKIVCSTPQFVVTRPTGGFTQCLGPKTIVGLDDTDTPSAGGHGTHVAGIVAGTGKASGGEYHGAAPRAKIYGVSIGTAVTVENALDGLQWVLDNHDIVRPRIRVVNNSWGSRYDDYDPEDAPLHKALWKLQELLVDRGVTVVFAAGNAGGDGSEPATTAECVNPTPGVVCVADYDDGNTGTRSGRMSSTSSRGHKKYPATWPDLSAPGTQIVSTCRLTLPVCNAHAAPVEDPPNLYAELSGTSMAAPHVSGIVAQLLQARPSLTPAQVENVLEDSAHKFSSGGAYRFDPLNRDDTSSFDKGHGLVDVRAALRVLLGR